MDKTTPFFVLDCLPKEKPREIGTNSRGATYAGVGCLGLAGTAPLEHIFFHPDFGSRTQRIEAPATSCLTVGFGIAPNQLARAD